MLVSVPPIVDPATRLPVAVIDTSKLNNKLPGDHIVLKTIKQLPKTDFCLVLFASHSPKPSLSWLQNTKKLLDRDLRKRVQKVYLVHETWLYKTVQKTVGSIFSPKFAKKLVYIKTLSQLAQNIDITLINIARDIYLHDLQLSDTLVVPKHSQPVYGLPISLGIDFIDQIMDFLYVAPITNKSFESTGGNQLVWVLMQAFDRNQTIDLAEYGPQMVIAAFKLYLYELPEPLVPIESIELPIEGEHYLTRMIHSSPNAEALLKIQAWFAHVCTVYHIDPLVVAESFGAAMFKLTHPTSDETRICTRVARMLASSTAPAQDKEPPSRKPSKPSAMRSLPSLPEAPPFTPSPPALDQLDERPEELRQDAPQLPAGPKQPSSPRRRMPLPLKSVRDPALATPTLKPGKPILKPEKVLKQKPSMRNIKGARVGELALKYENI